MLHGRAHSLRFRGMRKSIVLTLGILAAAALTSPRLSRAQTGASLMLKPFPRDEVVDAHADGFFENGGHTQGSNDSFRLGIYETEGRFRLNPGELTSPRVGYSFTW